MFLSCYTFHGLHGQKFFVFFPHKLFLVKFSSPQINKESCAISLMSILSSKTTEKYIFKVLILAIQLCAEILIN